MKKAVMRLIAVAVLAFTLLEVAACGDSFTVSFLSDGKVYREFRVESGKTIEFPEDPTLDGYEFVGWSTEPDGDVTEAPTAVSQNMTFYAVWRAAVREYTVTFLLPDGTILPVNGKPDQKVEFGKAALAPEDPVLEGHTFKGWDKPFDDIRGATDVTALFDVNSYTLTYSSLGALLDSSETVAFGEKLVSVQPESVEGLTFSGWCLDTDLTRPVDFEADTMPAGDLTLFAKWTPDAVKNLKITAEGAFSVVYGGTLALSADFDEIDGFDYAYLWYANGSAIAGEAGKTLNLTGLSAGTSTVRVEVLATSHGIVPPASADASAEVSVSKRALTVTADSKETVYGSDAPAFSAAFVGLADGDSASDLGTLVFDCDYAAGSAVGGFQIVPKGLDAANYDVTYAAGTLAVKKAKLTVTASDALVTYGGSFSGNGVRFSGFVLGQGADVLSGELSLASDYRPGDSADTKHAIRASGFSSDCYELEYADGTLSVERARLEASVERAAIVYGDILPEFKLDFSGFVLGEDESALGGAPVFECEYRVGSAVGSYEVTALGLESANYSVVYAAGTLTVERAKLVARAEDKTTEYGSRAPGLTVRFDGLRAGDGEDVLTELSGPSCGYDLSVAAKRGAGNYPIAPGSYSADNYELEYSDGTLTVGKKTLTATLRDAGTIYGDGVPGTAVNYSGFVFGEDKSVLSGSLAFAATGYAPGSGVGTYELIVSRPQTSDNYEIDYRSAVLTVSPRKLTLEFSADKSHDHQVWTNDSWAGKVRNLLAGHVFGGTLATVSADVGNYESSGESLSADFEWLSGCSVLSGGEDVTANYTLSYVLHVRIAANIVTSDATPFDGAYDGAPHSITVNVTKPQDYTIEYRTPGGEFSAEKPSFVDAGSDTVEYRISAEGFETKTGSAEVIIRKRALTITAKDVSLFYGQGDPAFGMIFDGFAPGEDESALSGTPGFDCSYAAGNPVGSYPILPKGYESANYEMIYAEGTLTVNRAPLVIRVEDQSVVYGEAASEFTSSVEGLFDGDSLEDLLAAIRYTCAYEDGSGVGSYPISAAYENANYDIELVFGTLTVSKRTLTVRIDDSNDFDGSVWTRTELSGEGLLAGHTLGGTISTKGDLGTFEDAASDFATENIVVSDGDSDVTANYALVFDLRVVICPIDMTAEVGEGYDGIYTADNHLPSVTVGSLLSEATVRFSLNGTDFSASVDVKNAGSYSVTVEITAHGYNAFRAERTVVVAKRVLNVAADAVGITFGDAFPAFSAQFSNFADGENESVLTGTLGFDCGYTGNAGSYEIVPKGFEENVNYSFHYIASTLTVAKKELTVTAMDAEMTYGEALPGFTAEVRGFVNGENESVLGGVLDFDCEYLPGTSNSGDYAITPKGFESGNYSFRYVPSNLRVNKADYSGKSHGGLEGSYNKNQTLSDLAGMLDEFFFWKDGSIVPTLGTHGYAACYNEDPDNFNDFELEISVALSKGTVEILNTVEYEAGFGGTITGKASINGEPVDDAMIIAECPTLDLNVGGVYPATFRIDPEDPNYSAAGIVDGFIKVTTVRVGDKLMTIEDALLSGQTGTFLVTRTTNFAPEQIAAQLYGTSEFTIPEGVTVLVPFGETADLTASGTATDSKTYADKNPAYLYSSLSLTASTVLNVRGTLATGGVIGYPGQPNLQGHTSGNYGQVNVEGTLNVYGKLDCYGYVKGSGTIRAYSGSSVYSPYVVRDFRGGSSTGGSFMKGKIAPFSQYEMPNIQSDLRIDYGAIYYGYANLYASSSYNKTESVIIGAGGIIEPKENGYVIRTFAAGQTVDKTNTMSAGITTLNLFGGAVDNAMELKTVVTVNTGNVLLGIPYNYRFVLNDGVYDIRFQYKLLTGAALAVGADATLNLGNKAIVYADFTDVSYGSKAYPAGLAAGDLTVFGTLNLLDTAAFGGMISGGAAGATVSVGTSSELYLESVEGWGKWYFISGSFTETGRIKASAQLANGETPLDLVAGKSYVFDGAAWSERIPPQE